jgi:phospholipid/cholesterol/gamma-HCH transport system substrate-binding protein
MDRDRRLSLTVGGFAILSLGVLAAAILSLSAQQGLFSERYRLVAYFDNVQGLVSGAAVRLAGTQVGQVAGVDLSLRPSGEPAVRVTMNVDEDVRERIRKDSIAQITTLGLLGDQIVEITIGSAQSPALESGAEIAAQDPFDLPVLASKGGEALDAVTSLAGTLHTTLSDFEQGMGGRGIANSPNTLGAIVNEVQEGQGVLHNLIYEPYEGSAIPRLESSLASLDQILLEVRTGEGVLHSLIYEKPNEQDVILQVLEAGARLNSILGKIDRGEGTLGLLLNDPTLYEELKLLVGGANRSTVVRTLIEMVTPEAN